MTAALLALAMAAGLVCADAPAVRLIAHRGGVVDRQHIENNLPGIEEAVRRGYWMLEVDIRRSKDGKLVVHHDADFRRFYRDDRRVADMTWDGKIRLMLDTKGNGHDEAFFTEMIDTLRDNGLLASALVIGSSQSRKVFLGKASVGTNLDALRAAIARGEDVGGRYFLFAHADRFDAETIALCRKHGVAAVPSINTFHYLTAKHKQRAAADIARLKQLGVTYFQIDSVYEDYCNKP